MTAMVEKVAIAIIEVHGLDNIGLGHARALARAAIEAMMEPTPAMIIAGEDNVDGQADVSYIFTAMIQEALKEGQ